MQKIIKKTLAVGLILSFMILNAGTVFAMPVSNQPSVYSPEFPNAYVEVESVQTRSSDSKEIVASVYVEEQYDMIDGEMICTDSRLLSKDEVEAAGKDSFSGRSAIIAGTTSTKEKLTLVFNIPSQTGYTQYRLRANAQWNGGSGKTGPASGDDFIGFAWGGGFDSSSPSIIGRTTSGALMTFYAADAVANAGRVWGFSESSPKMSGLDAYITLKKNTLTGNGNTTSFIAKYIHTYQTAVGSISISATSSGVGVGFSLSSCANQWSVIADLGGYRY